MIFSDRARLALIEAKDQFGSYSYNDKGPDEVMDVDELVRELKKLPTDTMITQLLHLASRTDCPLDPSALVTSILHSLDEDEKYDALFENEDLCEHY